MQLTLRDVGLNPTRDGILEVLERMGAKLHLHNRRRWGKEPVADITVRSSELKGIEIAGSLVTRSIDEIPAIAVAAAAATGTTRIRDAEELRIKESDRLSATALELGKLGADIEETSDGLIIEGSAPLRGAVCSGHGDHRVAMALAVAGLLAEGETVVEGAECAAVSFPGFADIIGELAG
jgi:3-phosphoshikimate 1-carboxyvinyltransferase